VAARDDCSDERADSVAARPPGPILIEVDLKIRPAMTAGQAGYYLLLGCRNKAIKVQIYPDIDSRMSGNRHSSVSSHNSESPRG
jgi:hypothetical protein